METMAPSVGILPAAGSGSRLKPFNYPKELLPVRFTPANNGTELVPMLVIEHSLAAMQQAGVDLCLVVTTESKPEILRYLGDGSRYGVDVAYLVQTRQLGLAHAVDRGYRFAAGVGCNTCLALPDTVFWPMEALAVVLQELVNHDANLVLGVFPTQTPEQLGPVRVTRDGTIEAVYDKPLKTDLSNTWALAAWTPCFSDLLHEEIRSAGDREVILGHVFHRAVQKGLHARAVQFPEGVFHDLGTPFGLTRIAQAQWAEAGQ
jgi:glucose-1-phosphate thymidylyltransferase